MVYRHLILLCAISILTVSAPAAPPVTRVYIPAMGLTANVLAVSDLWSLPGGGTTWDLDVIGDQIGWLDPAGRPEAGPGNIVLAGHYTVPPSGEPGAFYNLAKLDYGDFITVQRPDGTTWDYRVIKTAIVDDNDMTVVFDYGDGRLTLIGCPGPDYSRRRVVVAEPVGQVVCIEPGGTVVPCIK